VGGEPGGSGGSLDVATLTSAAGGASGTPTVNVNSGGGFKSANLVGSEAATKDNFED
jgi:hypothetical protein